VEFIPCHNYLLVRQDENPNTVTKSGLVVLDGGNSIFLKGVVVSAGSGVVSQWTGVPMSLSCGVGDHVVYVGTSAEYMLNGLKYVIIRDTDVVGILRD
jgi:co-chaperonin GroES (HSP10)